MSIFNSIFSCLPTDERQIFSDHSNIPQQRKSNSQDSSFGIEDTPQLQVYQQPQKVSDIEVDEICQGLTSLKSLALAVQEEEGIQNEKLDSLTTSVDRANERLTAINKRVKKMT